MKILFALFAIFYTLKEVCISMSLCSEMVNSNGHGQVVAGFLPYPCKGFETVNCNTFFVLIAPLMDLKWGSDPPSGSIDQSLLLIN